MNNKTGENQMFYNEYTKKDYQGKNVEILKATGLTGGFLTYNQARNMGGVIPKGTKAVAKLTKPLIDLVETKNGLLEEKLSGRKFSVFHVSQVEFDNKESA